VLTDFSRPSDSRQIFALDGFSGELQPLDPKRAPDDPYPGATDRKDPALSPLFADLKGMPPTLLVTCRTPSVSLPTARNQRVSRPDGGVFRSEAGASKLAALDSNLLTT
jgi:acetyl esterase/lipase